MPTSFVTVRRATSQDNVLLAELGAETFRATYAAVNTPENMQFYLAASFSPTIQAAELAAPDSCFWIAERDGEPVGFARMRRQDTPADLPGAHPIELERIYARSGWIGHGVGAALMEACLAEAARRNCDTIWLGVWEENSRALAFYGKWGFRQVGIKTFTVGRDIQRDFILARSIS